MLKKFFKETLAIIGYLFGLIGTAVTIYCVPGSITIQARCLVILGFVLIALIAITVRSTKKYADIAKNGTRHLITAYDNTGGKECYYVSHSENLRIGTLVTIYYCVPRSKILGYGIVINESYPEYVEIEICSVEPTMQNIFNSSKSNAQNILRDMYILPNVYVSQIADIAKLLEGGNSNG